MPPWVSNVVQIGRLANFAVVGFTIALAIATSPAAYGQTPAPRGADKSTNVQHVALIYTLPLIFPPELRKAIQSLRLEMVLSLAL
jgi:hypothetical protein